MERLGHDGGGGARASNDKMVIKPNVISIDKYIRINKDQYMFFLQLLQECDIYDYEIYNEEQIIRKGRNIFQIKNNGKQYHYLLASRNQTYFLKFYFYRIVPKSNEIQLIDEKFLFIEVNKWLKENKNSAPIPSSLNTFVPKNNVHMEIKPSAAAAAAVAANSSRELTVSVAAPIPNSSPIDKNPLMKEYIMQQQNRKYHVDGSEEDGEYEDDDIPVSNDVEEEDDEIPY